MSKTLPPDFLWGYATASFQIEGSVNVEGRGPSIWDDFSRTPGRTLDGRNGDVATDSYRRWKEDIALLKQYGAKAYRFSISWPRIVPSGSRHDPVNQRGIDFYNKVIDELLANGITPFVTLYHWDLPQGLHDAYGGWLNKDEIAQDYAHYARVCFKAFGDRVRYWITMNEPWCIAVLGYGRGIFAPGRSSDRTRSPKGDSSTEPWIVGHHVILAHAHAVKIYREEFKPTQNGVVGITLNGDWAIPYNDSPENVAATQHHLDTAIGWFADPIYLGFYPPYMREMLGDRLPDFTEDEWTLVKHSSDFYGMNTYTTNLCMAGGQDEFQGKAIYTFTRSDGTQLGAQAHCAWLQSYPDGFRQLTKYLYNRYELPIFCMENGFAVRNEDSLPLLEALDDKDRVDYFKGVLEAMLDAIYEDGVILRAYFPWSFLDNFEWADGYGTRFGVTYVDYGTQARYPKSSATFLRKWFAEHIEKADEAAKQEDDSAVISTSTGVGFNNTTSAPGASQIKYIAPTDISSVSVYVDAALPELSADSPRTAPSVQSLVSLPADSPFSGRVFPSPKDGGRPDMPLLAAIPVISSGKVDSSLRAPARQPTALVRLGEDTKVAPSKDAPGLTIDTLHIERVNSMTPTPTAESEMIVKSAVSSTPTAKKSTRRKGPGKISKKRLNDCIIC